MTRAQLIAAHSEDATDRWLSCFGEAWEMARADPFVAMVFRKESICRRCSARKRIDRRARLMFCVPCASARGGK